METRPLSPPFIQIIRPFQLSKRTCLQSPPIFSFERVRELPGAPNPVGAIGGPPCQAFSLSNGHKTANDPRAELSKHYAGLLKELNQAFNLGFFVFENVLGLRHKMHADELDHFQRLFEAAGFWIFNG